MSQRRAPVVRTWWEFVHELRLWLSDSLALARCRLAGGHETGTWRALHPTAAARGTYEHTWCRRCGWCEQTQSFDEERIGAAEGWYAE